MSDNRILLVLLLALTSCACAPRFENPLPYHSKPRIDRELMGSWFQILPGSDRVSFVPRQTGWFDILISGRSHTTNEVKVTHREGFSTRVAGKRYVCTRTRPGTQDKGGFLLATYEIKGTTLRVLPFVDAKVVELVRSGRLVGKIIRGKHGESARVIATGEAIAALLAKEGVDAFVGDATDLTYTRRPSRRL